MLAAAVMTPAVLIAALVAVVAFAPLKIVGVVAVAAAVGIYGAVHERAAAARGREVEPSEAPELHAIVERLCVVADLAKPRIVVEDEQQPNSWIVSLGRGHSRLHVTEGLLDRLEWSELEAVVGHELAHVAHRDAAVMTVVGGPGAVLLGGGMRVTRGGGWWFLADRRRRGDRDRMAGERRHARACRATASSPPTPAPSPSPGTPPRSRRR